ncbi:hypothetical protein M378DRAFT_169485, partial [Amanita muscaria Koide BX008]
VHPKAIATAAAGIGRLSVTALAALTEDHARRNHKLILDLFSFPVKRVVQGIQ